MYDRTHKVIVVGDDRVGKSTLVSKFLNEALRAEYMPTVGVDFHVKLSQVEPDVWAKFAIWDTSGQPMFRTVIETFFATVEGCIAMYDVTDRRSYEDVIRWITKVKAHNTQPKLKVMLVGNKADLSSLREVSTQEGLMTAEEYGWEFAELDYATPSHEIFSSLSRALAEKPPNVEDEAAIVKRESCCKLLWAKYNPFYKNAKTGNI